MSEPWLTILGVGEGGWSDLGETARAALSEAQMVIGPQRHLGLLPGLGRTEEWPVPFADGIARLMAHRGTPTVALASGDPFWFGAGSVIARHLDPGEWRAIPGPSIFSLAAARLGWPLESTACLGLHAAPLSRLRPHLASGARLIATLRDGAAVKELAAFLSGAGFGASRLSVLEALGGPRERVTSGTAEHLTGPFDAPVAVAIEPVGGAALPLAAGRPDTLFEHDGQITKRPVRALTLSALAPRPGERLWDIGGGSGSVALEWLLAHPSLHATSIEQKSERAARIRANAERLGLDRLEVVESAAPEALDGLLRPDAVFVGGGLSAPLLDRLVEIAPGARLVANAVTLETERLVLDRHAAMGGELMRIDIAEPTAIGTMTGWRAAFPITQWRVTL